MMLLTGTQYAAVMSFGVALQRLREPIACSTCAAAPACAARLPTGAVVAEEQVTEADSVDVAPAAPIRPSHDDPADEVTGSWATAH